MKDSVENPTEYQERLLSFLDLCGFKEVVSQTMNEGGDWTADSLYRLLKEFTSDALEMVVIGSVPTLGMDGSKHFKTADELEGNAFERVFNSIRGSWPISITHFSDSFVISTPANNEGSTRFHFQLVRALVRALLRNGITVRGGMTAGKAIHESSGVLFGPAMNRAYELESGKNFAQWPRVLIDSSAHCVFEKTFSLEHPHSRLTQKAEHDFWQVTPASCAFNDGSESIDLDLFSQLKSLCDRYRSDEKLGPRYNELMKNWMATHGLV